MVILVALRPPGLFEAHWYPSKRYKNVTVPVLIRYINVTAMSNIYYNTFLLCDNNGSSQVDLFICANYRGSSFYVNTCFLVFAAPLPDLVSLILRFCSLLVL